MNIYLNSVLVALFFRSKFENIEKFSESIIGNFKPEFNYFTTNKIPMLPGIPDEMPIITAINKVGTHTIQISKMRLDLILRENISATKYDESLNNFLKKSKTIISSIDFDNNICTRIGIVESSFYFDKEPITTVAKVFFKPKSIMKCKDIKTSFTHTKKIQDGNGNNVDVNKVIGIEVGNLNLPDADIHTGIIQNKDINNVPIGKINLKIIENIFTYAQKEMGMEKALEILDVK